LPLRRIASADLSGWVFAMSITRRIRLPALEFGRYFVVSLIALAVDVSVLMAMSRFMHYLWAASLGFVLGAITSYWLAIRWAFTHRRLAAYPRAEFLAYSLVGILSLGINNLVIFVAVEYLALALLASKAVAAGATFAFNYGVRKFVLFRK
jgi:putative flippase GtrA